MGTEGKGGRPSTAMAAPPIPAAGSRVGFGSTSSTCAGIPAQVDEVEPNPTRDPAAGIGGAAMAVEGLPPLPSVPMFATYLGGGGGWYGGGAGGGLYVQGGHE